MRLEGVKSMTLGDIATAASVLIAAAAILFSHRQNLRSAQLQVLLTLGHDFRTAWRERWRSIPSALASVDNDADRLPPADYERLLDALNWIDWFGIACRERIVRQPDFIFDTVGPNMAEIIIRAGPKLSADEMQEVHWLGVAYVTEQLQVRNIRPHPRTEQEEGAN
jgi:hypothetical protein